MVGASGLMVLRPREREVRGSVWEETATRAPDAPSATNRLTR